MPRAGEATALGYLADEHSNAKGAEMSTSIGRLAATTSAALLAVSVAPALASTHYAAPNGSAANWPCASISSPCDLTTAIQGTGAQAPASGDEVVIENNGTPYVLSNAQILAPVAENIHGATGSSAPLITDAFSSTIGGDYSALTLNGGSLSHVDIRVTQSGNDQNTSAAASRGQTTFEDDVFASSSPNPNAQAVSLYAGDKLLDSVADAAGPNAAAVFACCYPGENLVLRNVTAYAIGLNSVGIYALDSNPRPSPAPPCPTQAMTFSIRNTILEGSSAPLGGSQMCPGDVVNFDIDYSDYNPTQASLPSGLTATPGGHNINQPAAFSNPGAFDFHELTGSPTIDKGANDPQDGATDPDGRARLLGAAPDIGAYEFPAAGAVTEDATDVTTTSARMNGTVDSEGTDSAIAWAFEYGTSANLGQTVPIPDATLPAGVHPIPFPQPVNELLTGLAPGTTYYYRVRASNSDGETFGALRTFTTDANLTVMFQGNGHGVVNSSPDIGGCGTTCTLDAKAGTPYTLTATPGSGTAFVGWSGACSGTGPCKLTLSTNATVTALFEQIGKPTLGSVRLTGPRSGKPKLRFTVTKGALAPPIKRLEVSLSAGFAFGKLHHAIHVSDRIARARVSHGVLIIKLPVAVPRLTVALKAPAITVTNPRRHLRLTVTVKDASGTLTRLVRQLK